MEENKITMQKLVQIIGELYLDNRLNKEEMEKFRKELEEVKNNLPKEN